MAKHAWKPDTWYGTTDPEIVKKFTTYSLKYRRGKIWLRVYHEPYFLDCKYHFTSNQGANSDDSFSGLLPREFNELSLEEAQDKVLVSVQKIVEQ